MAITDIVLSGKLYQDDGDAVSGATVALLETGTTTSEATTTTDSNGAWTFTEPDLDTTYDIKITSGTSVRYILWSDEITTKGVDTASLKVRGANAAAAPIYLFADRADTAGIGWRIQATTSHTLAIGSDKARAGTIIDYLTITNGASAAASVAAFGGDLTVGDDLSLTSDSAVFKMGADSGFSITHDGDIGATIAGSPITITAAEASTWSTSSGALTITSAAALNLNPAGGSAILLDGTISVDAGVVTGATSITSTAIELGHASDTTIARSGSGAITVEGTQVLLAGAALTGSTIDATTDFTIGDTVITNGVITDTSGLSIAAAVDLGANTLTSTGSMQIRTIDYSDGDLAMTIADGGGVTFAENATFSGVLDITDSTDASDDSGDTGALRTEGGASIAKKLYVGSTLEVNGKITSETIHYIQVALSLPSAEVAAATPSAQVAIPADMNGMLLVEARAVCATAPAGAATTINIRRHEDDQNMCSTIDIATSARTSTGGSPDAAYDDVATDDMLHIDVASVGSTPAAGVIVTLGFAKAIT